MALSQIPEAFGPYIYWYKNTDAKLLSYVYRFCIHMQVSMDTQRLSNRSQFFELLKNLIIAETPEQQTVTKTLIS